MGEIQIVLEAPMFVHMTGYFCSFQLINQGSGKLNREDIGPISLEFEISGYLISGLRVRFLKVQGCDKSTTFQSWVRTITASDSYIVRT